MPALIPFLIYEDPAAAVSWLSEVFGFEPGVEVRDRAGDLVWCEVRIGDAVAVATRPLFPDRTASPRHLGGMSTAGMYVYVDDVDAHYRRALEGRAEILQEPADSSGDRSYRALDLEGHVWRFASPFRRVEP